MFNYFDSLFFDYCHLEKPKIKNAAMSFTEEEITSFIALILIIISGIVLYCCCWCDVTYHVAIGPVISISALAVLTRMLIRQRNKPSLQQYSEHMSDVRKILERHKISLDDSERIKELIDYASKAMERSNPLSDIKKAFTVAGSIIAVVWSILSNGLNPYADLEAFAIDLVAIAICVIATCFIIIVLYNVLEYLLFPKKRKLQQLIDDLKQLLIFNSISDEAPIV